MFGNNRKSLKASATLIAIAVVVLLAARMLPVQSAEPALQAPTATSLAEAATAKAARLVVEQAYYVMSETRVVWVEGELEKTFTGEALTCMDGTPCSAIERQMEIVRIVGTDAFDVQPPTPMATWILAVRNAIDDLDRCLPETNPGDCEIWAGLVSVALGAIPLP